MNFMEDAMARAAVYAAITIAFLVAGCAGESAFEDRSDEVRIKHRIPSK